MKSFNILQECTYYQVNLLKVSDELRNKIMEEAGLDSDCVTYMESEDNIDYYGIPSDAIDYDSQEFDEDQLESILEDLVGKFPHYLVFAGGCKWNGSSGYKFCDHIVDTVYRDYDIEIVAKEQGKNALLCSESSHDVPMGAPTYIVGLTEKEYDKLSEASFDEIEAFVQSRF